MLEQKEWNLFDPQELESKWEIGFLSSDDNVKAIMASHEVSWEPQYSVMVALIGAEVTEPGGFSKQRHLCSQSQNPGAV